MNDEISILIIFNIAFFRSGVNNKKDFDIRRSPACVVVITFQQRKQKPAYDHDLHAQT